MKKTFSPIILIVLFTSCVSQKVFKSSVVTTDARLNNIESTIDYNLKSKISNLTNQLNTLEREIYNLRIDLNKIKAEATNQQTEYRNNIEQAEKKIDNLDRTVSELRIELLKLKNK